MHTRWSIRTKLYVGSATLCVTLLLLTFSGLRGPYAYKHLAWTITQRSSEIPRAAALTQSVADLRALGRSAPIDDGGLNSQLPSTDPIVQSEQFRTRLADVRIALQLYRERLDLIGPRSQLSLDDNHEEWRTVREIELSLDRLERMQMSRDLFSKTYSRSTVDRELDDMFQLASSLPNHLHGKMQSLVSEVRGQYRTWIYLSWISGVLGAVLLAGLIIFFYVSIFRPLRELVEESRKITAGNLSHRIPINTGDEVGELAKAMNDMTDAFQTIRDNLNEQVRLRTSEVVRSEQLASVGFLAAGVAHEINNPLASIAWCAESLESRLDELLEEARGSCESVDEAASLPSELEVVHKYLRRIQEEAFRCKGITEKLLDFSRLGDVEKQPTDLLALVISVIEMVQTLGTYRDKHVRLLTDVPIVADVNAQEFRQVLLNLLTNALDSLDPGGEVTVSLRPAGQQVELDVRDNGCGMTAEVLKHLFEPFFTRRRNGQGTGLGMSITYRIIQDHEGTIEASSDGPGKGSRLLVTLPRHATRKPVGSPSTTSGATTGSGASPPRDTKHESSPLTLKAA